MDHHAAVLAGAGSDVHYPVGLVDGVLVVLDDDQGVAEVPEPGERFDQAAVVPLVQADGRLVQDVEHAHQAGADLGGQPDALGFAAGQGPGRAFQVQVLEPDVEQEGQPGLDFLEDLVGDLGFAAGQDEVVEEVRAFAHGQRGDLGDGLAVDQHRE